MADDGKGGQGAGGAGAGDGGGKPDPAKELEAAKARIAELEGENTKLKGASGGGGKNEDPDLNEKVRLQKEQDDKKAGDTKAMERALRFTMGSEDFLKKHESLLPKDVGEIFKAADKEKYSSAIEKDAAIKAGIVQSFFAVQANVDLLTPGLKSQLDDYLALTKNGKQEQAQKIYDNIFEPAFEMLKRIKKAEALNKGYGSNTDADTAYKNRLMGLSRKHYLGEKQNGT